MRVRPAARCMLGVVGSRFGRRAAIRSLQEAASAGPRGTDAGSALPADSAAAAAAALAGPSRSFPSWGPDPDRLLLLACGPVATQEKVPGDVERREALGPGQLRLRR